MLLMKTNLFLEFKGLSYSSIFSMALNRGEYEMLLDFLSDCPGLTEREHYSIGKVFGLYLEYLSCEEANIPDNALDLLLEIQEKLRLVVVA